MMRFTRQTARGLAALLILAGMASAQAQSPAAEPSPPQSALTAELFYELLLGELNNADADGDRSAGYALILDAAVKSKDPQLFQRAVELALQARSPDAALRAAGVWRETLPDSREANRYLLRILLALNRIADTQEPLRREITAAPTMERNAVINTIPPAYARASDRKQASQVVEQALAGFIAEPGTGAAAWTTIGRMRLAAGDTAGALDAAVRGQAVEAGAEGPALLALELLDGKQPQAEALVLRHLEAKPTPAMRLAYARALLDDQRYAEATAQLQRITGENPDFADAWLLLGGLQAQDGRLDVADAALKRFLTLAEPQPASEQRTRALAQAYLGLAQVAEKRKDYAGAEAWLNKIENAQDLMSAQNRRASLLARQGKLDEARALLRALPERNPAEARLKLNAEAQLLRDAKRYQDAYDLLKAALERDPKDSELLYEQSMMAEKLGRPDEMEKLLRSLIEIRPDYHHAYNALGYALADRNDRLPEAKQLIQKALELVPNDPFIQDSLGWVEFRMGNREEAARILLEAFRAKPDAEIAAHLGEVLWAMGQRERASAIWREGLTLNAENETLQSTLKRLQVPL